MQKIKVDKLPISKWQEYKKLRLRALQTDPQAFLKPYSVEATYPDEKWLQRLESGNKGETSWLIFAFKNNQLVGMVGGFRNEYDQKNHSAEIWGVYVVPEERGKGISKILMQTIIDKLQTNPDIQTIKLEVNTDQKSAKKLYESFGFSVTKIVTEQLGDGENHEVSLMEKPLKN